MSTRAAHPAAHTHSLRADPLERALATLAGLGFGEVELWLGHCGRLTPARAARALDAAGLAAVAVGGAAVFAPGGSESVRRAGALAEAIGAPLVIACVLPNLVDEALAALPPEVGLCIENHWNQPLATPRQLARAAARRPSVAFCLDTGHALLAGYEPERYFTVLGPHIRHVHLKDAARARRLDRGLRRRLGRRPAPTAPGTGDLSPARFAAALAAAGYDGAVTLEYEGPDAPQALAALRRAWAAAHDLPPAFEQRRRDRLV